MANDRNTRKPYLTEGEYSALFDRMAALRATVVRRLAGDFAQYPSLQDTVDSQVDALAQTVVDADRQAPPPPDEGLAELIGIGPEAAANLGQTRMPAAVEVYDETVVSERIVAVADLYYLYQHEVIGVFRVMRKLQELFRAGTLRLWSGPGAFGLYQFDRRQVLRYTRRERLAAYRRVLGYGSGPVPPGARANTDFHRLLTHFMNEVAVYWRDKRISDVIRERAYDPTFGSVAVVRRAGLDLRNNVKFTSYGDLTVLRVEIMQLLDEAFRILNQDDIKRVFGADNAWDVIEEVLVRYFRARLETSPRQRMAVTGRNVLRWLAAPHLLQEARAQFEALLAEIAGDAEEWLTSAQSLGIVRRDTGGRILSTARRVPVGPAVPRANGRPAPVT